ncbi:hypothetical protein [Azorhizobium oxalatiphilum]|nr:hypothetical protein [Azorhizobium oxalatiphilum]
MRLRLLAPLALAASLIGAIPAMAQGTPAPTTTLRGVVASVEGSLLTVTTRSGQSVKVKLADKPSVTGLVRISLADIPTDAYVGVAAVPQAGAAPGAPEKAVSVHVFMANQRGVGEGTHPYDVAPTSSMTNGALAQKMVEKDGQLLTIAYQGGEKKVLVTPDTSLVRFEAGTADELKPGAQVLMRTTAGADGLPQAARVLVGRDGVVPAL